MNEIRRELPPHKFVTCTNQHFPGNWPEPHCGFPGCQLPADHEIHQIDVAVPKEVAA